MCHAIIKDYYVDKDVGFTGPDGYINEQGKILSRCLKFMNWSLEDMIRGCCKDAPDDVTSMVVAILSCSYTFSEGMCYPKTRGLPYVISTLWSYFFNIKIFMALIYYFAL
jgi:hypothetical protein